MRTKNTTWSENYDTYYYVVLSRFTDENYKQGNNNEATNDTDTFSLTYPVGWWGDNQEDATLQWCFCGNSYPVWWLSQAFETVLAIFWWQVRICNALYIADIFDNVVVEFDKKRDWVDFLILTGRPMCRRSGRSSTRSGTPRQARITVMSTPWYFGLPYWLRFRRYLEVCFISFWRNFWRYALAIMWNSGRSSSKPVYLILEQRAALVSKRGKRFLVPSRRKSKARDD